MKLGVKLGVKLIVGLGNPGPEYELTPHNMGFLAVDHIADALKVQVTNRHCRAVTARGVIAGEEVLLAKPETFMNLSGEAVQQLATKYEADLKTDLIVLYDDLDFPLGTLKIREKGGPGTHNGMDSVIASLGTDQFTRIRLGVGKDGTVHDRKAYVLKKFRDKELVVVSEVMERTAQAVEAILKHGVLKAMSEFNRTEEEKARDLEKREKAKAAKEAREKANLENKAVEVKKDGPVSE